MSWVPNWFRRMPRVWSAIVFGICVVPGAVDAWMSLFERVGDGGSGLGGSGLRLVWAAAAVAGAVLLGLIYREVARQEATVRGVAMRSGPDADRVQRVLDAEQEARRAESALSAILDALPEGERRILRVLQEGPEELPTEKDSTRGLLDHGFIEKLYEGGRGVATFGLTQPAKTVLARHHASGGRTRADRD